ncbi:MAG: hypothetical protein ACI814_000931 [Mariniblastus sp.]
MIERSLLVEHELNHMNTRTMISNLGSISGLLLCVCWCLGFCSLGSTVFAQEQLGSEVSQFPTVLAERGQLILDDDGSKARGGKTISKFDGQVKLRAAAGAWERVAKSNVWRSTWTKEMGHTPVASYQGIQAKNLIVEVTFRYGPIVEPWQHQCFRIASDNRPGVTGHVVSAWANPNNDFIETGFLLQHIRKTQDKKIIEDLLLDYQAIKVVPEVWYTATLEIVGDEALFRMGDHVAYGNSERFRMPKNLVSLTLGTTWHEIKRVRIWHAESNPDWPTNKAKILKTRKPFRPKIHNYQKDTTRQ